MTKDKETSFTLAGTRTEAIARGRLPGGVKESLQAKQKSRGLCLGKSQWAGRRRDGVTRGGTQAGSQPRVFFLLSTRA